jgi:hypothetical protein
MVHKASFFIAYDMKEPASWGRLFFLMAIRTPESIQQGFQFLPEFKHDLVG